MIKYIYYLIICSILLFNNCKEPNTMPKEPEGNNPKNGSNYSKANKKEDTDVNTSLTADEEQKFNVLQSVLNHLITNYSVTEDQKTKYQDFMTWLENNPQKKKELANAFTYLYDFLNEQRIKQSSNLTTEQLIVNTIDCRYQNLKNASCNDNNHAYNDGNANNSFKNNITDIFTFLFDKIEFHKTNEERLESIIKDCLLKSDSTIAYLIGIDRLEAMLRKEKLNDSQKQGLDFLKEAFINSSYKDSILYAFLLSKEDKKKEVLDHINSELAKCSGDDAKINKFKDDIRNYFDMISDQKLDKFKDKVTIGC